MDLKKYAAFFHDGFFISSYRLNRDLVIALESAQLEPEWNTDNVPLTKMDTISGRLHCEGVQMLTENDVLIDQFEMRYKSGTILDFDVYSDHEISFFISWDRDIPHTNIADCSEIKIVADKIYWENLPTLFNEESMNSLDLNYYDEYFSSGHVIDIYQNMDNLLILMEGGMIPVGLNRDHVPLSVDHTIKGILHLDRVERVAVNDIVVPGVTIPQDIGIRSLVVKENKNMTLVVGSGSTQMTIEVEAGEIYWRNRPYLFDPVRNSPINLKRYIEIFYDGRIIDIQQIDNKLEISMSSHPITPVWNDDYVTLSDQQTMKGKLHLEGIRSIVMNDKKVSSMKMRGDSGLLVDFSLRGDHEATLAIQWGSEETPDKFIVQADKLYWENIPDLFEC